MLKLILGMGSKSGPGVLTDQICNQLQASSTGVNVEALETSSRNPGIRGTGVGDEFGAEFYICGPCLFLFQYQRKFAH
jgi:hypothetical protein